jgi:hypothetical protein
MNISRKEHSLIVDDGAGARYGLGAAVPAAIVFAFVVLIWPPAAGRLRFDLGAIAFVATALALAALKPPRTAAFDLQRREVRITIGWPPLLGRRRIIAFDDIREAKVRRFIKLGDLGTARPVLVLNDGRTVFLSTYNRTPDRVGRVIKQVQRLPGLRHLA